MKTMLLLILSTISLSLGQPLPDPVSDIDGKLLQSRTEYFIDAMGIGLTLATTRKESCPLDVVQADLQTDNVLPITFIPVDPAKGAIQVSTDLNIMFLGLNTCNQSNVWMLEGYGRQLIITSHGTPGNPGLVTITNWFKIEKYDAFYKLVYCPSVCDHCATVCRDIGVVIAENGRKRLAISDVPLKIQFMKA